MRAPKVSTSEFVSMWFFVVLAASILSMFTGWPLAWMTLSPHRILRGEVWRLVTWVFVETSPTGILMLCAAMYRFAGDLAPRWGERRLRRFVLEIAIGSAVFTTLVALVSDRGMYMSWTGGMAIGEALCIAWARQYPTTHLQIHPLVSLSGQKLIYVTVGITVLYTIYIGLFFMAPVLFAVVAAMLYPREWLARR